MSRIPAKAAGPSKPRSRKPSRQTCFPQRSMLGSVRAKSTPSVQQCSRPCALASADTSRVASLLTPNRSGKSRRDVRRHGTRRSNAMPDNQTIGTPPNPQAVEPPQIPPADPCAMVVFGAGGDMAKRLLIPALYNLLRTKVLPEKFALIGVDLAEGTAESWRDHLYAMLKTFVGNAGAEFDIDRIDEAAWQRLAEKMSYLSGDLTKPALYEKIRGALGGAEKTHGTQGNAI